MISVFAIWIFMYSWIIVFPIINTKTTITYEKHFAPSGNAQVVTFAFFCCTFTTLKSVLFKFFCFTIWF